jgi:hypothetical protein
MQLAIIPIASASAFSIPASCVAISFARVGSRCASRDVASGVRYVVMYARRIRYASVGSFSFFVSLQNSKFVTDCSNKTLNKNQLLPKDFFASWCFGVLAGWLAGWLTLRGRGERPKLEAGLVAGCCERKEGALVVAACCCALLYLSRSRNTDKIGCCSLFPADDDWPLR